MAKVRIPPPDIPAIDPASGRWTEPYYDIIKGLERLGFLDLADTSPQTVAALSSAGTMGRRSFVTDATATTFASIVVGGGSNKMPVYDDGTNWRIG